MNKVPISSRPRVALFAGPTASGKSAAALLLAERENGVIINADASQVYRDLRILTARPSKEEEARVPHRLYGHRDAADPCSATDWAADARAAIDSVIAEGRLPILVGGTGLYLRTLFDGIAPVPPIDPEIRAKVRALSTEEAHRALVREDRSSASRLHANDTARVHRALEVVRATGRSLGDWQAIREGGIRQAVALEITLVGLPVAELNVRCDVRARRMIDLGAVDEVRALVRRRLPAELPVMRAIGVAPLASYLRGGLSLDEALNQIQQATRNYAKRQRTWFRHQLGGATARM